MAAGLTDKFRKGAPFFQTTLSGSISDSDTSFTVASATGLPTDTAIDFVIDRIDQNGELLDPSLREVITGTVSGTTITTDATRRGLDNTTAQAHTAGAVVEVNFTSDTWNDHIDGILVSHNQDGTIKDDVVDTAQIADSAVETAQINDAAVTTAKIADANVTTAKIASGNLLKVHTLNWGLEPTARTITDGNPATVFPSKGEMTKTIQAGSTLVISIHFAYITFVGGIAYPAIRVRRTEGGYDTILEASGDGTNVSGVPMTGHFVIENVQGGTYGFTPAGRKDGDTSMTIPAYSGVKAIVEEHLTGSST